MFKNYNRGIHLDFHTSENIENIGQDFNQDEFGKTLQSANVDYITLFAKCHHGNIYYKDSKFRIHPNLMINLLSEQIQACKKYGIQTGIYISTGFDEYLARENPDWLYRDINGLSNKDEYMNSKAGFSLLCLNSGYLDILIEQVKEVMIKFNPANLFFDIIVERNCYCLNCIKSMKEKGYDINNNNDVRDHNIQVVQNYYKKMREVVDSYNKNTKIMQNGGNYPIGRRDIIQHSDYLEIESVPTGSWGYDHFPSSISYLRNKGKYCIGMTTKFHFAWGEFGGYKYPNAFLYEASQIFSFGAAVNIGDQLHPSGKLDLYTYKTIGKAFNYIKSVENYKSMDYKSEIGVLAPNDKYSNIRQKLGGRGAARILFELKYQFDMIDYEDDYSEYKLIIIPDDVYIDGKTEKKLRNFIENGGKILASGTSCVRDSILIFDFGAEFISESKFQPNFFRTNYELENSLESEALLIYEKSYDIKGKNIEPLAVKYSPYFNRSNSKFCSHLHSPCDFTNESVGVSEGKDGIYIACNIFSDYANVGSLSSKQIIKPLLKNLIKDKIIVSNLPSQAKACISEDEKSYYLNLLYANTIKRGIGVEVIEDIVPLYDIDISLNISNEIQKVILVPQNKEIKFIVQNGRIDFKIDKLDKHQLVLLIKKDKTK